MTTTHAFREDPGPAVDPDAVCDGCGVRGTVARARRLGDGNEELELHRFCAGCWPEESARLRARWKEQDRLAAEAWLRDGAVQPRSRGASFVTATWHGWLEQLEHVLPALQRGDVTPEQAGALARQIEASVSSRVGRMPLQIEAFLGKFRSHAG